MDPDTLAERRLLDDARSGRRTDVRVGAERSNWLWCPSPEDAAAWDEDRVVRAAFIADLIVNEKRPIHLIGARIEGDLRIPEGSRTSFCAELSVFMGGVFFSRVKFTSPALFNRSTFTMRAGFDAAEFNGGADFNAVAFGKEAKFDDANFVGEAKFNATKFAGDARFGNAKFSGPARFDRIEVMRDARFGGVIFSGDVRFDRAKFARYAKFLAVRFDGAAGFGGAAFTRNARFDGATFTKYARFNGTTFTKEAEFSGAEFAGRANFGGATFAESAKFGGAVFAETAEFSRAEFAGSVELDGVCATELQFDESTWETWQVSVAGVVCLSASFRGAVIKESIRIEMTCNDLDLSLVQARKRVHVVAVGARVECQNADIAANSRIEGKVIPTSIDHKCFPEVAKSPLNEESDGSESNIEAADRGAALDVPRGDEAAACYIKKLRPGTTATIVSLRKTQVAGVTISGMDLSACRFDGADGMDQLVVADSNTLKRWRADSSAVWTWWRTNRRMIADEFADGGAGSPSPRVDGEAAAAVAVMYRALRKALEDSKDEPGASDFYYGEMEMRRRASAWRSVERWLLTAYWAVSGYGLRAWRAVAALVGVVLVAGGLFTIPALAHRALSAPMAAAVDPQTGQITYSDPGAVGLSLGRATLFAAQETVALFRTAQSGVTLTGWGHVVDLAVRILGPVLIALAVLAIRNRTKR